MKTPPGYSNPWAIADAKFRQKINLLILKAMKIWEWSLASANMKLKIKRILKLSSVLSATLLDNSQNWFLRT